VIGTKPYGELKYRDVHGRRMAYLDEGPTPSHRFYGWTA